jgi:hypothetical protein
VDQGRLENQNRGGVLMGRRCEHPDFLLQPPILRSMGREARKIKSIKVDKTDLMIAQADPLRDEPYRRWIAALPCCVCGGINVQCAHVRYGVAGGTGYKPGDDRTVPLCLACHLEQGEAERKFWARHLINPVRLAGRLRAQYLIAPKNYEAAVLIVIQCRPRARN